MSDAVERARAALAAAAKAQEDAAAALTAAGSAKVDPRPATPGPLTAAQVGAIRTGYSFDGAALEMGALVNGEALADVPVRIPVGMMNRHGLVAGATGTGKTKTLQGLAEQLSALGVPVFAADIKGDLSGVASPGVANDQLLDRTRGIGQDWQPVASPTEYFSLGGIGSGGPVRAPASGVGP